MRWLYGFPRLERNLMFALTVPQVAATLAVALVAFSTKNAAGQRLIDHPMLNATVVLVIVSSLVGLVLTERAARQIKETADPPRPAPASASLQQVPPSAE